MENKPKLGEDRFKRAEPFPHFVLDDFYPLPLAREIGKELARMQLSSMRYDDHANQINKYWQPDPDACPANVRDALYEFNDLGFRQFLERATGIKGLKSDHTFEGGGVHIHTAGGSLGVHVDFNKHPAVGLHRRLNLLCFFNEDWDPSWGGQLELWSNGFCECSTQRPGPATSRPPADPACTRCKGLGWLPKECVQRIEPVMNRAVLLATTDYGFHGVAPITCPPDRRRCSLAFYYYSETRPPGEASPSFHWSTWPEMPG